MRPLQRLFHYTCLPLLIACTKPTARHEPDQVPTPTAPSQSPTRALDALQLARLDYTFAAAALLQRDWPAMQPAETCIMLVGSSLQWIVNCELAPPGFARTAQEFRDHPVFVHEGSSFEAGGRARTTAQLLAATPAAAQVPGPRDNTALPGRNPWLVVGSLEALTEHHPSFARATTEAWVSVVMHELVHTHQLRAPGSERFATAISTRERTPDALTTLYLSDAPYHALIEQEYALLTRAAGASDKPRDARRALKQWLTLYRRRTESLRDRPQLIADDALFSYIEGVARFVESQFLEDPSLHPAAQLLATDPRFDNYALFIGQGYAGSPNRQLDEHYFYAIGYHLCVLLDRLDPSWRGRVHTRENFLFDVVREVAATAK